ncbi:TetR/AcrR family transcriptional regulator [Megalodesulfovibrio paquesii]
MPAGNEGTRERILAAAAAIMHRKGFQGTGLKEILEAVHVPKGSFYHHFPSKEALGLAVLDYQGELLRRKFHSLADVPSLPPLMRLRRLFEGLRDEFALNGYRLGCPVGNLAQEMADLSEPFRLRIAAGFEHRVSWLAGLIAEGQQLGEIDPSLDSVEAARFLFASWQGTLTCMKVTGDDGPLEIFLHTAFAWLARRSAEPASG